MKAKKVQNIVAEAIPDFTATGDPEELEGGNLNHVWRLSGEKKNLIVKVAPPHIASNPEVPLSPERITFEANALKLFQDGNTLSELRSDEIRPPDLLFYDPHKHLLVMEDVGDLPTISQAIKNGSATPEMGSRLGRFIGRLHRQTYQSAELAQQFNNINIQQTRLEVQYKAAGDYAAKGGITNTQELRAVTESLGKDLLKAGQCLIMGDLWPPSLLVNGNNLRLIDWEFAHYGRPLQDVGHFAAHCWMQAHTSSTQKEKDNFKQLWNNFWEAYQEKLGEPFSELFEEEEINGTATHIGAEILVRAVGPFKDGYVYQSFDNDHPIIMGAVSKGRQLILGNNFSSLWI